MNKLRCLIVEDEPLAAEGLEAYIRDTPMLALAYMLTRWRLWSF